MSKDVIYPDSRPEPKKRREINDKIRAGSSEELFPPTPVAIGAVPEGKLVDFLTGRLVNDTPEEYVRQNLEKAIVRQYKYPARDCAPEFRIKMGSAKPRVDIVVFESSERHEQ